MSTTDIGGLMTRLGLAAVAAASTLAVVGAETKNEALTRAAAAIHFMCQDSEQIIDTNAE